MLALNERGGLEVLALSDTGPDAHTHIEREEQNTHALTTTPHTHHCQLKNLIRCQHHFHHQFEQLYDTGIEQVSPIICPPTNSLTNGDETSNKFRFSHVTDLLVWKGVLLRNRNNCFWICHILSVLFCEKKSVKLTSISPKTDFTQIMHDSTRQETLGQKVAVIVKNWSF